MNATKKTKFIRTAAFCILFILNFIPIRISGQCAAPALPPTVLCENAPLICLQNLCYETTTESSEAWPGFCGPNTAVHNPQFYKIITDSGLIEIEIAVGSCSGGQYLLQAAIIGACPWEVNDVYDCHSGAPSGTSFRLTAGGDPGQMFWLLIDGGAGSQCSYMIESIIGVFNPPITGDLMSLTANPPTVLQGGESIALGLSNSIADALGFYWVLGWSGDTITSTLPNITIDIPCGIDSGTYEICARAYSGCDTTDTEVCTQIEVLTQGPQAAIV